MNSIETLIAEFQDAVRSAAMHGDKEAFVEEVEATKDVLVSAVRDVVKDIAAVIPFLNSIESNASGTPTYDLVRDPIRSLRAIAALKQQGGEPVGTVVDNKVPDGLFHGCGYGLHIVSTAPHITLDVGTKLYASPQSQQQGVDPVAWKYEQYIASDKQFDAPNDGFWSKKLSEYDPLPQATTPYQRANIRNVQPLFAFPQLQGDKK